MKVKQFFFVIYDGILTLGWAWILYLSIKALITPPFDYWGDVNFPLKLLLLTGLHEILFTLFGLIKSSIKGHFGITLPRILLIFVAWGSAQVQESILFPIAILIWSAGEAIRYLYYTLNQLGSYSWTPSFLVYIRYTLFFFAQPVLGFAELYLLVQSIKSQRDMDPAARSTVGYLLTWALALAYIPFSVVMFAYLKGLRSKAFSTPNKFRKQVKVLKNSN
jgi:hypothetical protein